MASRIAHHIDFPDYGEEELFHIGELMLGKMQYRLDAAGVQALREYIERRMRQPHFANARSIRNALDRARLRHAHRLFQSGRAQLSADDLATIAAQDIRASRVFEAVGESE